MIPGNSGFETAFKYRKIYGSPSEINNSNSIGIAGIIAGKKKKIYLGNLDAKRDWGYAPEYIEAMWLMLQQDIPDDYVIGTGETHSVKEFLEGAFSYLNLGTGFEIKIKDLVGMIVTLTGFKGKIVWDSSKPDGELRRKLDTSKAEKEFGFKAKISFEDGLKESIDWYINFAKKNILLVHKT